MVSLPPPLSTFSASQLGSNPALDEFSLAGVTPEEINQKQMFRLIRTLIPLEACQYHQILPLSVEGKYLKLGMVDLDDAEALNYVRRTLGYIHCTLLPRPISTDLLQQQLEQCQQHLDQEDSQGSSGPLGPVSGGLGGWPIAGKGGRGGQAGKAAGQAGSGQVATGQAGTGQAASGQASNVTPRADLGSGPASQGTPDPMPSGLNPNFSPTANATLGAKIRTKLGQSLNTERNTERNTEPSQRPDLTSPADPTAQHSAASGSEASSDPGSDSLAAAPFAPVSQSPHSPQSPPPPPLLAPLSQAALSPRIPHLNLQTYYLTQPLEVLADLAPHNVLQELLGRALLGGIGRLYFEPATTFGKILWSQSGVLQSVLDPVEWPLYEGVIRELKLLAGLPPQRLAQAHQVDLERLYQEKRLLLRVRIAPQDKGEQATIQVLRGAALKFYEQQQISKLENDALQIAQQLHRKLTELRSTQAALRSDREPSEESLGAIEELKSMLDTINQRIQNL